MKKTTILIADDHGLMRMGVKALLSCQPDMTVVGEAEDGESAVALALKLAPDVVIMDIMMPVMSGAEATKRILADRPETKVICLTSFGSSADLARAILNGAVGAQEKESPVENLVDTIHTVLAGKTAIPDDIRRLVAEQQAMPDLTPRQEDILRGIVKGLSNQDIGRVLGISPESVKKHVSIVLDKLGVSTRSEAVGIALRKQLLKV